MSLRTPPDDNTPDGDDRPPPPENPAITAALNAVAFSVHMVNVYAAHIAGTGEPGRFDERRERDRDRHRIALAGELIDLAINVVDAARNLEAVARRAVEGYEGGRQ
jgi:hypothetical protein